MNFTELSLQTDALTKGTSQSQNSCSSEHILPATVAKGDFFQNTKVKQRLHEAK